MRILKTIGIVAEVIGRLYGWRRFGVAFSAGVLTVLALAPFHFWFVPFVSVPVLVWLLDGAARAGGRSALRASAFIGWAFGFGYFLAGLYWIGFAFLVEAEKFAWALPFAVGLLPAGLALFYGAAVGLASLVWKEGVSRTVALALALSAADWVRGHVLTGFPWNAFGYTLTGQDSFLQAASLIGVYGMGLFAVLIFALPALFVAPRAFLPKIRSVWVVAHSGALIVLLIAAGGYGTFRVPDGAMASVQDVRLRLVQPNIPQQEKWKPERRNWIFDRYLDLSQRDSKLKLSGLDGITHLIWPESALPFLLAESDAAKTALASILPEGTVFITGALRLERQKSSSSGLVSQKVFNSLFVSDHEMKLLSFYDKVHLVPFGEYLPLQNILEWLGFEQLTRMRGGFSTGAGPRFLQAPGVPPFSPLICYEIIFSGAVTEKGARPGWILNVTNDAWFGQSSGPYQHLHQARVRAVEEGLAVVRVANTGISAIIDPYGRVIEETLLNQTGIIEGALPVALQPTIFSRMGAILLCGLFAFWGLYLFALIRIES